MQPLTFDIDPDAVAADGLGAANDSSVTTYVLDGSLTSGGSFTSADGLAHRLSITDAGADDQTTSTWTIIGTDQNNIALTESLTGPGSTLTVETVGYFKTVTSVTIASPVATSTADMGTVDEISGQTVPIDRRSGYGLNASIDVTGTLNFTVQETFVDIQNQAPVWFDVTALTSKAAKATSSTTIGATAFRFKLNSYATGAEAQIYTTQVLGQ